jgi:hypothetical protein
MALTWNQIGQTGPQGPARPGGQRGPVGPQGEAGPAGDGGSKILVSRRHQFTVVKHDAAKIPPQFKDEVALSAPLPPGAWKIVVKHDPNTDGDCSIALASGAPLAVQRVPGVFNPYGEQTPTTLSSYASVSSATAVELRCDGGSGAESGCQRITTAGCR